MNKPHPHHRAPLIYGLVLSAILALAANQLGNLKWMTDHGFSALTIAIVLGMIIGNTVYPHIAGKSGSGVAFSKQTLLRAGVVFFGLRLTFQDVAHVGIPAIIIDTIIVTSTFILSWVIGTRVFGLERKAAMLIGTGSAICGAAAVMAAEPVVKGRAEQVTVAVATVVIFGTLAIFLYPYLYSLNLPLLPHNASAFGIYAGSSIHEVAQVVAAAGSVSADTANTAVITKMVRVMMLAPFLIALSVWLSRDPSHQSEHTASGSTHTPKMAIPWFAFGFIGVVIFNSLHLLPHSVVAFIIQIDTLLLAMAMGALGLSTHVSALRQAGIKPILLGLVIFLWLIIGGAAINKLVMSAFGL